MVNQYPFLLEALARVDNNTFLFQQHLKVVCDSYCRELARVFFHLNNSYGNKWFDFKIPFQSVYIIIPFSTCFLMGYLKPIVLEFYHVLAKG
jgi:hypothetical protein